jgi:hypothetical protein
MSKKVNNFTSNMDIIIVITLLQVLISQIDKFLSFVK